MPNWYSKQKEQSPYAKYEVDITGIIEIPRNDNNKVEEEETATYVLKKYLPDSNDASVNTGIISYVNLDINNIKPWKNPLYNG